MQSLGERLFSVLHESGERVVATHVALDGSPRHVSAAQLAAAANAVARAARQLKLPPRALVGIAHAPGPDLHAAWLGALWAGLVPTILAPPSPRMEARKYAEGFRAMAGHLKLAAVLTDPATETALGGLMPPCPALTLSPDAARGASGEAPAAADFDAEAVVQHSSGTTGAQKAVGLTSRQVLGFADAYAERLLLDAGDVIVSWLPLYHDMGFIACLVLPLLKGNRIVEMSPFDWVRKPTLLFDAIDTEGGTLCWLPNFAFSLLSEERVLAQAEAAGRRWRLDRVRAFVNCSEPVMAGSIDRFVARHAPHGIRREQVIAGYGMAEGVFAVAQNRIGQPCARAFDSARLESGAAALPATGVTRDTKQLVSSGHALPGMRIEVRNADGGELPDGRIGEICIAGPFRFDGYRGRPDLDGAIDARGFFATGDLGFLQGGELFVTGRAKDLIILYGRNFHPQDIEAAVGAVPGVKPGRVAAFSVPDEEAGTEKLVVLLELEEDPAIDAREVVIAVRREVAQSLDCVIGDLRILPPRTLVKSTPGKIARADNRIRYLEALAASEASRADVG